MRAPIRDTIAVAAAYLFIGIVPAYPQSFTGPATITQPTTKGDCVKIDPVRGANNLVDAGAACGTGAGAVPGGSNTQLQYNNAGAFGGIAGAISDGTTVQYTDGDFLLENAAVTGGSALHAPATTGHTDFTLPATSDTLAGIAATQTLTNKTITDAAAITVFSSSRHLGLTGNSITADRGGSNYISATTALGDWVIVTNGRTASELNANCVFNADLTTTCNGALSITVGGINVTGRQTFNSDSAASNALSTYTGVPFTGGSGTTTFPFILHQPTAATAVTTWSTSGTIQGWNEASGFAGNIMDAHVNGGASVYKVGATGALTAAGVITFAGVTTGTNADFACFAAGGVMTLQTTACTVSSLRFKENVHPFVDNALDVIGALKVVTYRLKRTMPANLDHNATANQIGLTAENIAATDRRCAIYEPDMRTPKSYRQECVIAVLVAAVQEQQREINHAFIWIMVLTTLMAVGVTTRIMRWGRYL